MQRSIIRIVDVEPIITRDDNDLEIGLLNCYLENGDNFILYNVPPEITRAIAKLRSEDTYFEYRSDNRETIFELLIMLSPRLRSIGRHLGTVIIDGFDEKTMTYRASLFLEVDGVRIKKTMIPSHAIFLALLFNKPIYVTDDVVRISKELEEGDEDYFEVDE